MKTKALRAFSPSLFFVLSSLILAFSQPSLAAIGTTNVNITGFSDIDRTQTNRIIVYAGAAGDEATCRSREPDLPCNNCTTTFAPCNKNRIHSGLEFNITFTSTTATTGKPKLVDATSGTAQTIVEAPTVQSGTFTLTTTWAQICNVIAEGESDCSAKVDKELTLGLITDGGTTINTAESIPIRVIVAPVDAAAHTFHTNCDDFQQRPSGEGLCQFQVYAGDGKVYFSGQTDNKTLISPTGLEYTGVEVFYEPGDPATDDFSIVTPLSESEFIGLTPVDGESPNLDTDTITGLTNGVTYFFRMANVDRAGNIYHFSAFENEPTALGVANDEFYVDYLQFDQHTATPDEVFGVLDDELSCFIATAAYGSPFQSKVEDFREFRNVFLNSNPLGRQLVQLYYRYSPPLAHWVAQSEGRRNFVRVALWPVWATSKALIWLKKELLPSAQAQEVEDDFFSNDELPLENADDLFQIDEPEETDSFSTPSIEDEFSSSDLPPLEEPLAESPVPESFPTEDELEAEAIETNSSLPEAPPAPMGRPIRSIKHPDAAKGLVRIDRDGTYHYRTPATSESASFSLKFGNLASPEIISQNNRIDFTDVYGDGGLTAFWLDYEWPYQTSFGKFGIKFASGVLMATGNGLFAESLDEARESYTFLVIPTVLSIGYRFQFVPQPWLVPYAEVGGGSFNIAEIRDDGADNRFAYSPVTTTSAGVLISLTSWNRESAFRLDSEYGINNMWLDIAFRGIIAINREINFDSSMIHAGITVDY